MGEKRCFFIYSALIVIALDLSNAFVFIVDSLIQLTLTLSKEWEDWVYAYASKIG